MAVSKTLVVAGLVGAGVVGVVVALRRRPSLCQDIATGAGAGAAGDRLCGTIEQFVSDVGKMAAPVASAIGSAAKGLPSLIPGVGGSKFVASCAGTPLNDVELAELERRRAARGGGFVGTVDVLRDFCGEIANGWTPEVPS